MLGITRAGLIRLVQRGGITPAIKMPGKTGAYLFEREDVEALIAERAK